MCGFANFVSLGILIGGLGTLVPERRGEIIELGLKSILSGTLATHIDRGRARRTDPVSLEKGSGRSAATA